MANLADKIKDSDMMAMILAIDCGEFSELACLCDPTVREAYEAMLVKFNVRERYLIFKRLCQCAVSPPPPPEPEPAPPPGIPVAGPPAPAPGVTPPSPPPPASPPPVQPPAPVVNCPPGTPPPNSFT